MEKITKNIVTVIKDDEFEKSDIATAYWGTEPSEEPSIEFLIPMMKIKDLTDENIFVTILLADVHAFLNKDPTKVDQTDDKIIFYKFLINVLSKSLNINIKCYDYIKGSDMQLDKRYVVDLFKFMNSITVSQAVNAGQGVLKQQPDPCISTLIYPLMQVLDETVINADIQLCGERQIKIVHLAQEFISTLGYEQSKYMLHGCIYDLTKRTFSDTVLERDKKIYFTDSLDQITKKITRAKCPEKIGNLHNNPLMSIVKYICYPYGYCIDEYKTYTDVVDAIESKQLSIGLFKTKLINVLDDIIAPFRETISKNRVLYDNAFIVREID